MNTMPRATYLLRGQQYGTSSGKKRVNTMLRVKKPTSRDSDGYWRKREYDAKGKETYYEDSYDYWRKCEYDAKGNETYYETSTGYWSKRECDAKGKETYFEDSDGCKEGTPLSQSCDGKVIEVDGKKYKLTEL